MREDMAKVIVERPRQGSRWSKCKRFEKKFRYRVQSDQPEQLHGRWLSGKVGIKKSIGGGDKSFNEHLSPLKRYLARNVGRPWNKVFSEISAHLKLDSTVQRHVHEHLEDFVATSTWSVESGIAYRAWLNRVELVDEKNPEFYVDPRSGLLRKNKLYKCWQRRWAEAKRRKEEEAREGSLPVLGKPDHEYLKLRGIWFEVARAWFTHPEGHRQRVVVGKRQLNKKELKELGLKNEQEWPKDKVCQRTRRCAITREHYVGDEWFRK